MLHVTRAPVSPTPLLPDRAPARMLGRPWPRLGCRALLIVLFALSVVLGHAATPRQAVAAAVSSAGPELTRLLRAMAVLKLGMAVGALGLASWRFRFPLSLGLASGYVAGCALMAAGAGVVWGIVHVALGAALVHTGLLLILTLALVDGGLPLIGRKRHGERAASAVGP